MAAQHYERRRGDRRRASGYGTYTGPERRTGADRRHGRERRGNERRRTNHNGEERESYYYGGQKKQQNPVVYFGIAGGAVLLIIIIIAVAASGGSNGTKKPGNTDSNRASTLDMQNRARDLVGRGGAAYERGNAALQESGQTAANPYLHEAYNCWKQAHELYVELDRMYPGTRYAGELEDLERNMYEVMRKMGTE
jgi:hypothetical protein